MVAAALAKKIALNDLARAWQWKPARLYRLCAQNRIPHVVVGGRIYFEEPALEQWLAVQRKTCDTPLTDRATQQLRTRLEECTRLGIEPEHEFS